MKELKSPWEFKRATKLWKPTSALADYANNILLDWFSLIRFPVLSIIFSCST